MGASPSACVASCMDGTSLDDLAWKRISDLKKQKQHDSRGPRGSDADEDKQREYINELPLELQAVHEKAKTTFSQDFSVLSTLSHSGHRVVLQVLRTATGGKYAVKRTDRKHLDKKALERCLREALMLRKLESPYIVSYEDFYVDPRYYYLVTEEICGGMILEEDNGDDAEYKEERVKVWMKQILQAVAHAHALGIVHRDIRVSNIMLTSRRTEEASVKIVDWGCARIVANDFQLRKLLGHPGYMAPEVVTGGPYGRPADMWSVGVVCYFLLCGYSPFHHDQVDDEIALFRTVCTGLYVFDSPYWDAISADAKDFVKSLLQVNPKRRKSAAAILSHRWFGVDRSVTNSARATGGVSSPTSRWTTAYNAITAATWIRTEPQSALSPRMALRKAYRLEQIEPESEEQEDEEQRARRIQKGAEGLSWPRSLPMLEIDTSI